MQRNVRRCKGKQPQITVNDIIYNLDLFFNGDLKFVQICLGLCSATGNYACPWCIVHKDSRLDISKSKDHYNADGLRRTYKSISMHCDTKSFGCKNKPLLQIDPEKVVPDELHLFLRISDILLDNLIEDCRQQDTKLEILKQKAHQLENLQKKINACGVNFHTWSDKAGQLQYTSLTGSDYKKLYRNLPEMLLFVVANETHDDAVFLWREFEQLHKIITKSQEVCDTESLFERICKWTETFLGLNK